MRVWPKISMRASPGCVCGFGEIGDTRLTVMAALSLSDELAEAKEKLKRIEAGTRRHAGDADAIRRAHQGHPGGALSAALNSAAERIERMARRLNETVRDGGVAMG